jgi:prepilin-type N-terminal cleavage/methylation domain-containing protein
VGVLSSEQSGRFIASYRLSDPHPNPPPDYRERGQELAGSTQRFSATPPPRLRASARDALSFSPAFTLIELMTVISIIVLVLALAVPVVSSLQGNRSVEAGYNKVAAALAHARQIALYYRSPAGVVFFQDPVSGRQQIGYVMPVSVLVQQFPSSYSAAFVAANVTADTRFVDLIPNEELVTFPLGVAVEVLNGNAQPNPNVIIANTQTYYDPFLRLGVAVFDENGQLAPSQSYWIAPGTTLGNTLAVAPLATVGNGSSPFGSTTGYGGPVAIRTKTTTLSLSLYSTPAVCIFDETAFTSQSSVANSGSGSAFNDGNNNSILYYGNFLPSTEWTTQYNSSNPYIYLNQQAFTTGGFPGRGYLVPNASGTNVPTSSTGEIDLFNEAQWLNTNGQIYAIKPNDGSLLKNQ